MKIPSMYLSLAAAGAVLIDYPSAAAVSMTENMEPFNTAHRRLADKRGVHKVLIVRVNEIKHTRQDLANAYFGIDGLKSNTLKSILEDCSFQQLKIQSATGEGVEDGVIQLNVTKTPPENYTQADIEDALNTQELNTQDQGGLDYDLKIFITSLTKVQDMEPPGWSTFNGTDIWIDESYALAPKYQVSLYGTLLGYEYSAVWDKNLTNNEGFGDGVGYMGSNLTTNEDGAKACFNGPKSYHSGWYNEYVYQHNNISTPIRFKLVGLDALAKQNVPNKELLVIKYENFYTMYNRATGINNDTAQGQNQITVTYQHPHDLQSWRLATLDSQKNYTYEDFNLTIKACSIDGDFASVEIGHSDSNFDCTSVFGNDMIQNIATNMNGRQLWRSSEYKNNAKEQFWWDDEDKSRTFHLMGMDEYDDENIALNTYLVIKTRRYFMVLGADAKVEIWNEDHLDASLTTNEEMAIVRSGKKTFKIKVCNVNTTSASVMIQNDAKSANLTCTSENGSALSENGAALYYSDKYNGYRDHWILNNSQVTFKWEGVKSRVIKVHKFYIMLGTDAKIEITQKKNPQDPGTSVAQLASNGEWAQTTSLYSKFKVKACNVKAISAEVLIQPIYNTTPMICT